MNDLMWSNRVIEGDFSIQTVFVQNIINLIVITVFVGGYALLGVRATAGNNI